MAKSGIIKWLLDVTAGNIIKNEIVRKHLFTKTFKEHLISFYENDYYQGYAHLNKAILTTKNLSHSKGIILDIGGADGRTAKLFASSFPENEVWVFEPIKTNIEEIKKSITSIGNIKLIPKAVGNKNTKDRINIAARITSSSLFQLNADESSTVFADALRESGTEEIVVTRLDDEVPSDKAVSIMKIDVQGYELEVLKGGINLLQKTSLIVLEMNNHDGYKGAPKYYEIDEFLRMNNFVLYDIFPSVKDKGRLKEWDSIYIHNRFIS